MIPQVDEVLNQMRNYLVPKKLGGGGYFCICISAGVRGCVELLSGIDGLIIVFIINIIDEVDGYGQNYILATHILIISYDETCIVDIYYTYNISSLQRVQEEAFWMAYFYRVSTIRDRISAEPIEVEEHVDSANDAEKTAVRGSLFPKIGFLVFQDGISFPTIQIVYFG